MEVEVSVTDRPPIPGHPTHNGKYLVVKLPSIVKNGNYCTFDRKNQRIWIVNYGVTYFVEDVPSNFELGEESLRKVNDIVKNSYPDDIIKQIKIISNSGNGSV